MPRWRLHGTEDASPSSGHATNVSVIGALMGPEDLVIGDAVVHNSIMEGVRLSGAKRILFPHGDLRRSSEPFASTARAIAALVVVEGLYGMDGDMPNLPPSSAQAAIRCLADGRRRPTRSGIGRDRPGHCRGTGHRPCRSRHLDGHAQQGAGRHGRLHRWLPAPD
jgi:hypothetical protein